MQEAYAREYRALYEKHWWWRAREKAVLKTIRRVMPPSGLNILDVGCGDALIFPQLSSLGHVEGLETDRSLLSEETLRRYKIYVQPFDRKFEPGKKFDLILMLDVLEHLAEPAEALERAHDLLADGGRLLITVPSFRALWTHHDVINRHFTRYRKKTLAPLLRRQNLKVLSMQYWFQWTFPVKLAVRFYESIFNPPQTPPRVPPDPINRALYLLSRFEQVSFGPLMPLGTSLMALCEREEAR